MTNIGFRATPDDERIIKSAMHEGENTTDVIRRALRLLDRQAWLEQARADAARLADEDLSTEPDAW
ncbi:hypothetical protein [Nonomuraea endophytica]|uniref:Antitoxin ParD1/3/4 n=1 Tax=Nonomuraea endophytica TaxID=714136 RepID=A0A7W8EKJ3_9ACTN|nr:hypothetical protein [Nonomuraea endophytica]MBB5082839.1 antitoxin ParD1/3/4 [Nonomuraea endophytica]